MKVKWYGTATLVLTHRGESILFDPYLPINKRLPAPAIEELGEAGSILITHSHFDHIIDVPRVAAAGNAPVFCSDGAAAILTRDGLPEERIHRLKPGDRLDRGVFRITIFRGAHIRFNPALVIQTLISRRVITYRENMQLILKKSKQYPPHAVLAYLIEAGEKKILHLGSLNLEQTEEYPSGMDLLTIPYQGRSDIDRYALSFIRKLQPKRLFLHHFDDSFPPVTSSVDTAKFKESAARLFPGLEVTVPEFAVDYSV